MTNRNSVSFKAYVTMFILLGLVWSCMPFGAAVYAQTSKQQDDTSAGKTRTSTDGQQIVTTQSSGGGLWDGGALSSARGGTKGGGGNGGGKGKKSSPTPTPTPTPTPSPSPSPTPTPSTGSGSALAAQWEVAARPGVKLYVDHPGWYKVTATELSTNGFDTSSDSYYWQLFRDGVEVPMAVDANGTVEFFGEGSDSRYTKYGVYFLTSGTQAGLRLEEATDAGAGSTASDISMTNVVEKPKTLYLSALLNGDDDNWWGPGVSPGAESAVQVDLEEVDASQPNSKITLGISLQGFTYVSHVVNVRFNNYTVGTMSFDGRTKSYVEFDIPASTAVSGANNFYLESVGSSSDVSVVDYVSVTYTRKLKANGEKIRFNVAAGDNARVDGFSSTAFSVYQVENKKAKKKVDVVQEIVNGTYGFSLSADSVSREFVAVADSQKESVQKIEENYPSSWHDPANSAEFIIVTPYQFGTAANQLAARRNSQGLPTAVVYVEDIADEFGFGTKSPDALRSFFQYATSNWANGPGYVLLLGDASYDQKNYLGLANNGDYVPTKLIETFDMETSSDGWLVDFDDDGVENISIGRLPANSETDAAAFVNKIERYENYSGDGSRSAAMAADTYFEIPNDNLQALLPSDVASTKIDRSVLGDSATKQAIKDAANAGPTMVSYLGHGSTIGWTDSNLFTRGIANNLTNDKLSFYLLMTCLNGYDIDPNSASLAESLVKAPNAAIAAWASSGTTYASGQTLMSQDVVTRLFTTSERIGDVVRLGKQTSSDWDVRRTWQLYGDPTLVIK